MQLVQRGESFEVLLEDNWTTEVSGHALRTLHLAKKSKVQMLPLTEDVVKMSNYLQDRVDKYSAILREETGDKKEAWHELASVSLTQLILFNRRRQGEVSKATLSDYSKLHQPSGQRLVHESLSDVEKELCKVLHRFEVTGIREGTSCRCC